MTTATEYRQKAQEARDRSAESFARSDTDGFATQAASDLMARQHDLSAAIAEEGGTWEFPALFDLDGNLVAAKLIDTRFGRAWAMLSSDDPSSSFTGQFFNPSQAEKEATRVRNDARKGFYVGTVRAAAAARMGGGGKGFAGMATCYPYVARTDGGFSRDVEVVDNGQETSGQQ